MISRCYCVSLKGNLNFVKRGLIFCFGPAEECEPVTICE